VAKKILMKVTRQGLTPVGPADAEVLSSYREGAELEVRIFQLKKKTQEGKFWAMLGRALEAQDTYPTTTAMKNMLLARLGYAETVVLGDEKIMIFPMSLTEIEGDDFSRLIDSAADIICEEVCPGMDRDLLLEDDRIKVKGRAA